MPDEAGRPDEAKNDNAVEDLAIDIAGLLFELRIATAAVHCGLETLAARSEKAEHELGLLLQLSDQTCEALETLQALFVERLDRAQADLSKPVGGEAE